MAKIKRKKLERGVKLVKEHVYTPLAAAVTDLNNSGLDAEQLECQWAPFRLNFSIPYLGEDSMGRTWATGFVLPPLQDTMSLSTTTQLYTDLDGNANQPYYVTKPDAIDTASPIYLDEVSFSFDQRDAPGAIASPWYDSATGGSEHQGKISFDDLALCDLRLAIVEKEPLFFTPVQDRPRAQLLPTREVWSAEIGHAQFGNDVFNNLPFVVSGINQLVDQWKSYAVSVSFPGVEPAVLHSATANKNPVFPSVELSLKFRSKIRKRNTRAVWAPENAPTPSLTKRTRSAAGKNVSHSAPADGDKIAADTAQGVNINIASVDEAFRQGVYAGFSEDSAAGQTIDAVAEELEPDSCYEVLTVPLFQNSHTGGWSIGNSEFHPYATGESSVDNMALIDRRIIPISYPMQIEHVVVALNFTSFRAGYGNGTAAATVTGDFHPSCINPSSSQQWEYEFGVGVGTGLHADEFEYAQVAHGTFKPGAMLNATGGANNVIDRMMAGPPDALPFTGASITALTRAPNCELWCLPLSTVGGASATGSAYFFNESATGHVGTQGVPIFTGRAWTQTETRTDALANVSGREQWIEVRGKVDRIVNAWTGLQPRHLLVGYQGFFVYIIGRKFLSS